MSRKKILFIDRDGTIIKEPLFDKQIDSFEKLEFLPGVITSLSKISKKREYLLVMVTNQDGLGTESFPENDFSGPHELIQKILRNEGIIFDKILVDRSFPEENSPRRKPAVGMVLPYLCGKYDLKNSFVIGDRITDMEFAKNIGCRAILLSTGKKENKKMEADVSKTFDCPLIADSWNKICSYLTRGKTRKGELKRDTSETSIKCKINLDGNSRAEISTGLGFFDHMIEQLVFHSGFNLTLFAKGDLKTGPHHLVEDCAIVLGEAVRQALGNKKGIGRYGFMLPMDDSIAEVAIDLSGRSYLNWNVKFIRESIGDIPTEMIRHFFYSFACSSGSTIYIRAEGLNEHHKIEAIFKAFGKSIKKAVAIRNPGGNVPSTKGVLR